MAKAKDPKKLIGTLSNKIKAAANKLKSMKDELKQLKLEGKSVSNTQKGTKLSKSKVAKTRGRPRKNPA